MILIGVTGKAGSGKDTVGEILQDKHGFRTLALATPLKQMICCLVDEPVIKWDDRVWRETKLPIFNASPRSMAQTIGTEWGRNILRLDIWYNLALAKISDNSLCMDMNWAITDVRFENEAHRIRLRENGHIIHVHRAESDASQEAKAHTSEIGIRANASDFHVNNFGTVDDLAAQVFGIYKRIKEIADREKVQSIAPRAS